MTTRVDWKGDELRKKVHDAERVALDAAAADAVQRAKTSHPSWSSKTGAAEASIKARPAETTTHGARAEFGSDLDYFIFLEIGARGRVGDSTLRRAADGAGAKLGDRLRGRMPT